MVNQYSLLIIILLLFFNISSNQGQIIEEEEDTGQFNTLGDLSRCAMDEEHIFQHLKHHIITSKNELNFYSRNITIYTNTNKNDMLQNLFRNTAVDHRDISEWPSSLDLDNTMKSLIHIHRTMLSPLKTLEQLLNGGQETVRLNALHAFEISLFAMTQGDFDLAVEWMEWAIHKIMEDNDNTMSLNLTKEFYNRVILAHNEAVESLPDIALKTFDEEISNTNRVRVKRQQLYMEEMVGGVGVASVLANFWALCSGQELQTNEEKSRLFCFLDNKGAFLLSPLKKEQLSPQLTRIYDIVGNQDIERITRSRRTSKGYVENTNWVVDDAITKLGKKLDLITDMKSSFSQGVGEPLRLIEYTVGRYNDSILLPHEDNEAGLTNGKMEVACTVLFYLNDVGTSDGGWTAFSNQKVAVAPIKGSAVIWYNMHNNGQSRGDMWHTGCPVLYGRKISAQKWIRYQNQFQTWPCSLTLKQ